MWNNDDYGDDTLDGIVDQADEVQDEAVDYGLDSYDPVLRESVTLRLAKGRLYEMLLKADLFDENAGEDRRATQSVQSEIRAFAKERLEVMLGIKAERSSVPPVQSATVTLPFTSSQVSALMAIADNLNERKNIQDDGSPVSIDAELVFADGQEPVQQPSRPRPKPLVKRTAPPMPKLQRKPREPQRQEQQKKPTAPGALPKAGIPSVIKPIPMPEPGERDRLASEHLDTTLGGVAASGNMGGRSSPQSMATKHLMGSLIGGRALPGVVQVNNKIEG